MSGGSTCCTECRIPTGGVPSQKETELNARRRGRSLPNLIPKRGKDGQPDEPAEGSVACKQSGEDTTAHMAFIAWLPMELPHTAKPTAHGPSRNTWVLLAITTLALQFGTWINLDGYQLADSVEYMERAQAVVRNQSVIDSQQIRSFGFSALLAPLFLASDLLGIEDLQPVIAAIRLLQMGLGLLLVLIAVRIGKALGGPWTGFGAGLALATNPTFLRFSVSPVAGVSAAICVGLGVLELLEPPEKKRGRWAGLWLGLALWMAYKTIPITAALVLMVILRERRRSLAILRPMALTFTLAVILQVAMDRMAYGAWGASLVAYLGENVLGILARLAIQLGKADWADSMYLWYYADVFTDPLTTERVLAAAQDPTWYWTNLFTFAVPPVVLLTLIGVGRALRRATWTSSLLLVAGALNIYLFSQKGSKDFRLWLPLLPMLAPLVGWGLDAVLEACRGRVAKGPLAAATLIGTALFSLSAQSQVNTRKFGGFWHAMEYVREQVDAGYEPIPFIVDHYIDKETHARNRGRVRVASAYHWSVFGREGPDLHLIKLPNQLDGWAHLPPQVQAENVIPALDRLDWLIVHEPLLTSMAHASLMHYVNSWYTVEAIFWDPEVHESIGPVYVLRHKRDRGFDPTRPTFYELLRGPRMLGARDLFGVLEQILTLRTPAGQRALTYWTAECLRQRLEFGERIRLIRPSLNEELWILGSTYETMPGDGLGWLTTYMFVRAPMLADYSFVDRLTTVGAAPDAPVWENRHLPAYGVKRINTLGSGTLVRESWPVLASADTGEWENLGPAMGGAYRDGDFIPVEHWTGAFTFFWACDECGKEASPDPTVSHDCNGVLWPGPGAHVGVSGSLKRAQFGSQKFIRNTPPESRRGAAADWRWSEDGLTNVGRFFLPVQEGPHFKRLESPQGAEPPAD